MPKLHCSGDGFHGNLTLSEDQVKAAKKPKGANAKKANPKEKMASEMGEMGAMEANVLAVRRAPKKAGATKATALTKADAMPARVLKHKYDPVMAVAAKSEQKSSHSDAPAPVAPPTPKPKKAKNVKKAKAKKVKEVEEVVVEAPPAALSSSSKSAPKTPAKIPSPARAKTPAHVNVGKNAIDDPDANLADAFKELDFDV